MSFITKPLTNLAHWASKKLDFKKRVYEFSEGKLDDRSFLGEKGAALCELTRLEMPVPPGFIITAETCEEYHTSNEETSEVLQSTYKRFIRNLERQTGKTFGGSLESSDLPLLLSVRCGTYHFEEIPGVNETVLNIGINDAMVATIAAVTGNKWFALDLYRTFLKLYGTMVLKVRVCQYEDIMTKALQAYSVTSECDLSIAGMEYVVDAYKSVANVPTNPHDQLDAAIESFFESWYDRKSQAYHEKTSDNLGALDSTLTSSWESSAAVIVQAMVYGNFNTRSGTGIVYSRNPCSGAQEYFGEFLQMSEGYEILHSLRTPQSVQALKLRMPLVYEQLCTIIIKLEHHFKIPLEIEFTVEDSTLYILEVSPAKCTPQASVRIAVDMVQSGMISQRNGLLHLDPWQMGEFKMSILDPADDVSDRIVGSGFGSSPGVVTGHAVFDFKTARAYAMLGKSSILIRKRFQLGDEVRSANGIFSMEGGLVSHSSSLARKAGIPCVVGGKLCKFVLDEESECVVFEGNKVIHKDDIISINGCTGDVILGSVRSTVSGVDQNLMKIIDWARHHKRMSISANINSPEDIYEALIFGADSFSLSNTSSTFWSAEMENCCKQVQKCTTWDDFRSALTCMEFVQKNLYTQLFQIMGPKCVEVRLVDYSIMKLVSLESCKGETSELLTPRHVFDEIAKMQIKAIIGAFKATSSKEGISTRLYLLLPMSCAGKELEKISSVIDIASNELLYEGQELSKLFFTVGVECATPRSCIMATAYTNQSSISDVVFNIDSITNLTYGIPSECAEAMLECYHHTSMKHGSSMAIDKEAVGTLVSTAASTIRSGNRFTHLGAYGKRCNDPVTVKYLDSLRFHYVACDPSDIPVAQLAAAQANIEAIRRRDALVYANQGYPLYPLAIW